MEQGVGIFAHALFRSDNQFKSPPNQSSLFNSSFSISPSFYGRLNCPVRSLTCDKVASPKDLGGATSNRIGRMAGFFFRSHLSRLYGLFQRTGGRAEKRVQI